MQLTPQQLERLRTIAPGNPPEYRHRADLIELMVLGYCERTPQRWLRYTNKGMAALCANRVAVLLTYSGGQ